MKKILFTLAWLAISTIVAVAQPNFASQTIEACDTITNTPVRILSVGDIADCCYDWNGTDWVKRPNEGNCDNVVPGTCQKIDCIDCEKTCYTVRFNYETEYSIFTIRMSDGSTIDVVDCIGTPNVTPDFQAVAMENCIQENSGADEVSIVTINNLTYELSICGIPEGRATPNELVIGRDPLRFNRNVEITTSESVHLDNCTLDALEEIFNLPTVTKEAEGNYWTLLTKQESPHPQAGNYDNFTKIAQVTSGTHPTLEFGIDGWSIYVACGDEEPAPDNLGSIWIPGPPSDYSSFNYISNVELPNCGGEEEAINVNVCNPPAVAVCKDACVKGVKISVTIGYDAEGNVIWYRDEAGNEVESPDFQADCGPLTCETNTELLCAGEDNADLGISTGDEMMVTIRSCSDGTNEILSASLLTSLGTSFALPDGFTFQPCAGSTTASVVRCVLDEDGTRWREILINGASGISIVYQNEGDNSFGTPNGDLADCDAPEVAVVSNIDGKHCIQVGETQFKAFLFVNSDKSICAKPVGGTTVYEEGEYTLVSCCPATEVETTHLAGFTVERPTNTPNTGWNNELTTGSLPLTGDFELCFTIDAASGNTPQMIGLNSDPTTNASFASIDCALYLYVANGAYRINHFENGGNQGILNTNNWTGTEICFERVGSDLYFKQNGNRLNPTNPCNIGTGLVFLDDSHYYAPGFWGSGSITYSDFTLKTTSDDDIKSVDECCCEANSGGGMSSLNVTKEDVIVGFASGDHFLFTTNQARNSSVTRTAQGRYTVTFGSPHPDDTAYEVVFGQQEEFANRDVVKVSIEEGTKTPTGFRVQVTTDDNGGNADILTDEPFSYFVPQERSVVTDVSLNP